MKYIVKETKDAKLKIPSRIEGSGETLARTVVLHLPREWLGKKVEAVLV